MKRILNAGYLCLLASALLHSSCGKIVDCAVDNSFNSISATADATNVKRYTLTPNYSGSRDVIKVDWDFGDGQKQTTTGKEAVTHVYTSSGSKVVKATISTKYKKKTCTSNSEKTITVQ